MLTEWMRSPGFRTTSRSVSSPSGDRVLIAGDRSETGLQRGAYLSRTSEQTQESNVTSDDQQPSIALLPAAIAGVLAAIGVAGMVFFFVSASQIPDGNVGMRSTDAAYRAGATITPTSSNSVRPSRSIMISDEIRGDH
jgi:hypothetical protein